MAQLGSALRSGRRSRRFKSCHPDQSGPSLSAESADWDWSSSALGGDPPDPHGASSFRPGAGHDSSGPAFVYSLRFVSLAFVSLASLRLWAGSARDWAGLFFRLCGGLFGAPSSTIVGVVSRLCRPVWTVLGRAFPRSSRPPPSPCVLSRASLLAGFSSRSSPAVVLQQSSSPPFPSPPSPRRPPPAAFPASPSPRRLLGPSPGASPRRSPRRAFPASTFPRRPFLSASLRRRSMSAFPVGPRPSGLSSSRFLVGFVAGLRVWVRVGVPAGSSRFAFPHCVAVWGSRWALPLGFPVGLFGCRLGWASLVRVLGLGFSYRQASCSLLRSLLVFLLCHAVSRSGLRGGLHPGFPNPVPNPGFPTGVPC